MQKHIEPRPLMLDATLVSELARYVLESHYIDRQCAFYVHGTEPDHIQGSEGLFEIDLTAMLQCDAPRRPSYSSIPAYPPPPFTLLDHLAAWLVQVSRTHLAEVQFCARGVTGVWDNRPCLVIVEGKVWHKTRSGLIIPDPPDEGHT